MSYEGGGGFRLLRSSAWLMKVTDEVDFPNGCPLPVPGYASAEVCFLGKTTVKCHK